MCVYVYVCVGPPGGGPGGPPGPPGPPGPGHQVKTFLPPKRSQQSSVVMKRLHWDTLPPNKLEANTFWQKVAGPDVDIDIKTLESAFAQPSRSRSKTKSHKKKTVTQSTKSEKVEKKVTLLEPTRSRNVEIRLARAAHGLTPDELKEALLARFRDGQGHHPQTESPRHLSDADLSLLSQALPTEAEVKSIRSFKGDPNQVFVCVFHVIRTCMSNFCNVMYVWAAGHGGKVLSCTGYNSACSASCGTAVVSSGGH